MSSAQDRLEQLERELEQLRKERDYYKAQTDALAGESVKQDYAISTLQYALRQKRQGFALLSRLQESIGSQLTLADMFDQTVHGIAGMLGMNKVVALVPDADAGRFRPRQWTGLESGPDWSQVFLRVPPEWLEAAQPLLANRATPDSALIQAVRQTFDLPYFVLLRVRTAGEPLGLLLAGRTREQKPFAPPLDSGDVDTLQSIAALITAFVHNRQLVDLQQDNAALRYQATTDKLTGIPNRRYFEDAFAREWKRMARRQQPLSLCLLDVDHFKQVNDSYGHDVGDAILRQVAQRLSGGLRPGDVGARYGGEEFVLLLPETETSGAVAAAERVRLAIAGAPMLHEVTKRSSPVTASIGVATAYPHEETDPTALVTRADQALYAAKRGGRNRVEAAA